MNKIITIFVFWDQKAEAKKKIIFIDRNYKSINTKIQ